jgi:hypothetical protein
MFLFCFFRCCGRFSLDIAVVFFATSAFFDVALVVLEML